MPGRQQGSYPPGGPPSQTPAEPEAPAPPATPERTRVVYITDFEVGSVVAPADSSRAAANPDAGAAPQASDTPPPAGSSPQTNASAAKAQHLVKLMSDNLLKDFAKAGYTAKLLRPNDPRPDDGFLVTGVFTQIGPDNRLRRAEIGSGQSAEPLELYAAAQDLAHFTPPLYQTDPTDTAATNASAAIIVNPNADAVKFSMEADATDKTVRQTAQRLCAELIKRINAEVKSESEPLNKYAKP